MNKSKVKDITYGGLMIALVFIATAIVPTIPIPYTQGYIHTGDSMIFVTGILFGWRYGLIAGGIGSALADVYLSYSQWAIPTLIIKSIMGAIVGFMAKPSKNVKMKVLQNITSIAIASVWVILGISLKNLLNNILGNLTNSTMVEELTSQLDIKNIEALNALINKVQLSLTISIILIPTFIIIFSALLYRKDKQVFGMNTLMGILLAGIWMVIGYYFAGGILVGNMIVPIFSIPANLVQFVGGAAIALPIVLSLKKTNYFKDI